MNATRGGAVPRVRAHASEEGNTMSTELERITTDATTFWKYVFPTTWITALGGFNVLLWLDMIGSPPAPLAAKIAILTLWGIFSPFFLWWSSQMHHVWIDGDHLVVRPHGSPVRIPLNEVLEIKESRYQRVKVITLEFRREIPGIGKSLLFPAPFVFQKPFSDHPLVTELRQRKRLAAGISRIDDERLLGFDSPEDDWEEERGRPVGTGP